MSLVSCDRVVGRERTGALDPGRLHWVSANGQTSAVLRRDGNLFGVLTVTASIDGIDHLLWMVNPAKITAVSGPT